MPGRGRGAEAALEALQPLGRERDLGQQHQHLPAGAQRRGDGLEIDLGLAGAGHAVEQRDAAAACRDQPAQRIGRAALGRGVSATPRPVGIGPRPGRAARQRHGRQQPGLSPSPGPRRRRRLPALASAGAGSAGRRAAPPARRRRGAAAAARARGPATGGRPSFDRPRLERRRHAERELEHRPSGASVSRATCSISAPDRRRHRRRVQTAPSGLSRCARQRLGRPLVPDHADQLARPRTGTSTRSPAPAARPSASR